jgi:hypothetical protein
MTPSISTIRTPCLTPPESHALSHQNAVMRRA